MNLCLATIVLYTEKDAILFLSLNTNLKLIEQIQLYKEDTMCECDEHVSTLML